MSDQLILLLFVYSLIVSASSPPFFLLFFFFSSHHPFFYLHPSFFITANPAPPPSITAQLHHRCYNPAPHHYRSLVWLPYSPPQHQARHGHNSIPVHGDSTVLVLLLRDANLIFFVKVLLLNLFLGYDPPPIAIHQPHQIFKTNIILGMNFENFEN